MHVKYYSPAYSVWFCYIPFYCVATQLDGFLLRFCQYLFMRKYLVEVTP